MILVIDNYDSFTYNLVQFLGELGQELVVRRNDKTTLDEVAQLAPQRIVISPGPCTPNEAGLSNDIIARFGSEIPVLGVCLGHECIGAAYGGKIVQAPRIMHGKTSLIHHDGRTIFRGLPNPFEATRYHSLILKAESLGEHLELTAWTSLGEVMGVRHRTLENLEGVQFHPESFLTEHGHALLENFLRVMPDRGARKG